ncbi:MAG: hypothetical protein LBI45_07845 [Bacteroidales bacterium]|jgi:hypothetical protein|nr:hypothetical protein [Bacteroidales bacterium]
MKKLIVFFIFGTLFLGATAQRDPWYLAGNVGTTFRDFLGTTDCNPIIFKTRDVERMRLLEDKSFLGIGLFNPLASLHLHYQTDSISCNPFGGGEELPPLRNSTLIQLTTPETGISTANGFKVYFNNNNNVYFKQQEQANFYLLGPAGGLTIAPNGYVGIGGTPQQKFQVDGNTYLTGNLGVGFNNPTQKFRVEGTTLLNGDVTIGNDGGTIPQEGDEPNRSNTKFQIYADTYISGGSLGIGTTTPSQKLHVAGNAYMSGNLGIGVSNPTQKLHIVGTSYFNGNVGIGVSSPSQKLHVVGTTFLDGNLGVGTSTPTQKLHVVGTTYLNGNVGVGTGTPSQKLHVVGTTFLDGNLGVGTGTPTQKLHVEGTTYLNGNVGVGISSQTQKLHVVGNSYFNGNIGVGVSNPTAKIDVAGLIRAHDVKVCLNQGCDYVFEDGYNLMNLNDLKAFIKTNKHLPDVAPAAEMEAEGINLSEMNALLLRKVEELTLYIIQIENRLSKFERKKGEE